MTANSSGSTPNSGGISGKTATPSGVSSGSSATGHRGNDRQLVAVLHGSSKIIEIANVLIVEVDVDELTHLAVLENALGDGGILGGEGGERRLHRGPDDFDGGLVVGVLPHGRRNLNLNCH